MKSAMAGELDGLIFHNGGGSALDKMLDRAHYHVVSLSETRGTVGLLHENLYHERGTQAVRPL